MAEAVTSLFPGLALRQLPGNAQAEAAILGAVLFNNSTLEHCANLRPQHFVYEDHGRVFAAIVDKINAGQKVSALGLKGEFPDELLANLLGSFVSANVVPEYAELVRDAAARRGLIDVGESIVTSAFSSAGGAKQALAAINEIDAILSGVASNSQRVASLGQAMEAAVEAMEQARNGASGMPTGFRAINARLGGLEPGLVYAIAGRPAMGKSAVGHCIALNMARSGFPVLELSLEMSVTQLGRRALATLAKVPLATLKRGNPDPDQAERIVSAQRESANLPLWIDDAGGQTPHQIAARVREWKRKHGIRMVMIDHLNLVAPDAEHSKDNITTTTGLAADAMLRVAKENDVAVLQLVQLNRGVEAREDKRPTLADLRQSGNIEQDAYAVGFVYREEYYLRNKPEKKGTDSQSAYELRCAAWQEDFDRAVGKAEIIWAKVRDGEPGTDVLRFDGATTTFSEVERG